MTAAPAGPPNPFIFVTYSESRRLYGARREAFIFSVLGQALVVGLIIFLVRSANEKPPLGLRPLSPDIKSILPVIYSGLSGGGGGSFDKLPASHGILPPSSLTQLTPPTVI